MASEPRSLWCDTDDSNRGCCEGGCLIRQGVTLILTGFISGSFFFSAPLSVGGGGGVCKYRPLVLGSSSKGGCEKSSPSVTALGLVSVGQKCKQ